MWDYQHIHVYEGDDSIMNGLSLTGPALMKHGCANKQTVIIYGLKRVEKRVNNI